MQEGKSKSDVVKSSFIKRTWHDNPKFVLNFEAKERIPELNFEVTISRSEFIWNKKVSYGIVNSMLGVYIFQNDPDKWKSMQVNQRELEFIPKHEIYNKFKFTKVDPRGFIIMPSTYTAGVTGHFVIMVRCNEKFTLKDYVPEKKL